MTARILNVTSDEYFDDPCARPSLSQSLAHTLITRSPAHAYLEHPKLGGRPRKATKSMDDGTIVHSLLLGRGTELEVIDFDNYRKGAAQEARDAAKDAGRIPILRRELAEYQYIADRLREKIAMLGFTFDGQSEVAIEWEEDSTHGPVLCRGLFDHVFLDVGAILDFKTTADASPRKCERHVVDYGYAIQHAAYTSAMRKLKPELAGREDFVFLFCEIAPPYCVTPARLAGSLQSLGAQQWARAVATWAWCLSRDEWPAYTDKPVRLEAPQWALLQEAAAE